jgi:DNA repair protein RadC
VAQFNGQSEHGTEASSQLAKKDKPMRIADWPADERPRERLLKLGSAALSEAELLAIFLRTGIAGSSAVELGRELIARFGGLNRLFGATLDEFASVRGFGPAKFVQLQAVIEIARRTLSEEIGQRDAMNSPRAVRDYLSLSLGSRPHEVFVALFLDSQNRLLGSEELFRGTLTQTSVYPREVVKTALRYNAAGVILAHNHPSGVAEPSVQDQALTRTLAEALGLVDIKVLDHFIVAPGASLSFAERGLL